MTPREKSRPENPAYRTRLLDRRALSPGAFEIDLARPEGFSFLPGQRIRLCHGDLQRDYSLVNAPDEPILTLCVRFVKQGAFSPLLKAAPKNTPFSFSGPHGYFVFRPSGKTPVWVASGTGIAPFAAMCRSGVSAASVVHGVRSRKELYYADLFRRHAASYTPCVTASEKDMQDVFHGRATRFLEERLAPGAYDFYLCGRREMVRDATFIVDERFPGSNIYSEIFY